MASCRHEDGDLQPFDITAAKVAGAFAAVKDGSLLSPAQALAAVIAAITVRNPEDGLGS
jgi:hypothetical protein